jgi:altered-inheritance-of-mitochondria protein 13
MGADQSKQSPEVEEKVYYSERESPIQFSQGLINHLSDRLEDSSPSSERQSTLDAHVRSRIQSELTRLQEQEDLVRQEIETALEKENLDREKSLAKVEGEEEGSVVSAEVLRNDLEEVKKKVDRFHERRQLNDFPGLQEKQEAVVECYAANPSRPLDCWEAVANFKETVAQIEKDFVVSLR